MNTLGKINFLLSKELEISNDFLVKSSINHFDDIYNIIDNAMYKSYGKRPIGKQLGKKLKRSINNKLNLYFNRFADSLSETDDYDSAMKKMNYVFKHWSRDAFSASSQYADKLYKAGYKTGVVKATTKTPTTEKLEETYLKWAKNNPHGFRKTMNRLGKDIRSQIRGHLHNAYKRGDSVANISNYIAKQIEKNEWQIDRIMKTEVAQITGFGKVAAWDADPNREQFWYYWNNPMDERTKAVTKIKVSGNPYTFEEIVFLITNREQLYKGKWVNDVFNCRCTYSRSPTYHNISGNRFKTKKENYRQTSFL